MTHNDRSGASPSAQVNIIHQGQVTWMKDAALPFVREVYAGVAAQGVTPTDKLITATSDWYRSPGPANALDLHEFITVQFLIVDGLGVWLIHHELDVIYDALVSALKKLLRRHRKVKNAQPAGLALRIEASFDQDAVTVCLESDLHLDSDPAPIVEAFDAACRHALRAHSEGLAVYRSDGGRPRQVGPNRGRRTARAVSAYSKTALDPNAGPLQRAIEANTRGPTKLMRVAQMLEQHPNRPFPVAVLALACGCSERLIADRFITAVGTAARLIQTYTEPWADHPKMMFLRFSPPERDRA